MIEPTSPTQSIHLSLQDQVSAALERAQATSVGRVWTRHRPTWVLLRGWFLLIAQADIYSGSAFSVFPIPNVTYVPFEWSRLAILLVATAISWAVAKGARIGGRILDGGLTALVLYSMFVAAINS